MGKTSKFFANDQGEKKEFLIENLGARQFEVRNGGEVYRFGLQKSSCGQMALEYQNRTYLVGATVQKGVSHISLLGNNYEIEVQDERAARRMSKRQGASSQGGGQIQSPMPGKVVKIHVSEGDSVAKDQKLIVVEAMKMENEFKAPFDGVVKKVAVNEGDSVEGGEELVLIEKSE